MAYVLDAEYVLNNNVLLDGTGGGLIGTAVLSLFDKDFVEGARHDSVIFEAMQWADTGVDFKMMLREKILHPRAQGGGVFDDKRVISILSNLQGQESGADRNPFWSMLVASHFEPHIQPQLTYKTNKITISTPGGGWNSGTIDLFAKMQDPAAGTNIWIAAFTPEEDNQAHEVCAKVLAIYKGLPCFDFSIFIDTFQVKSLIDRQELHFVLGSEASQVGNDYKAAVSHIVAKVLFFLNQYEMQDKPGRTQLGDLKAMKDTSLWGKEVAGFDHSQMWFIPLMAVGSTKIPPTKLLRDALLKDAYLAAIDDTQGLGKGALIILAGPSTYIHPCQIRSVKLKEEICETLNLYVQNAPKLVPDKIKLVLVAKDAPQSGQTADDSVELCCLFASPVIKTFRGIANRAALGITASARQWAQQVRNASNSPRIKGRLERSIEACEEEETRDIHGHVENFEAFQATAQETVKSMNVELAKALTWFASFAGVGQPGSSLLNDLSGPQSEPPMPLLPLPISSRNGPNGAGSEVPPRAPQSKPPQSRERLPEQSPEPLKRRTLG